MMRTTTLCDQIRNIFIELDLRLKSKLHANQLPTIVERRPTATPKLSRTSKFQSTPASKYLNPRRVRQPFLKLATPVPSHLGPRDQDDSTGVECCVRFLRVALRLQFGAKSGHVREKKENSFERN